MSRAVWIVLICSSVALIATVAGGIRHDYIYYLEQWQLVLADMDPWSTNNAYGPLHNAFALLLPLGPLAPKLANSLSLLLANAMLVAALLRQRPWPQWRAVYLVGFAANTLPWIAVFWFGNNDGFVAALVIGAVLARRDGRLVPAGLLLGLATLDKYYPALLIPFFALDARRLEPRIVLAALLTIAAGIAVGMLLWGNAFLEALTYGVSRDATILSIFRPIAVIGRANGWGDLPDTLVRFNGPLVLLVWIGALLIAWVRRDHWLVASTWGLFAVLLTYKVGNQQYWVTWLALVACLPLLARADSDRLGRISLPYASFLSLFQLGFVLIQPEYYRGPNEWVKDFVGIPSFALGLVLLIAFLRTASGASADLSPAPHPPS